MLPAGCRIQAQSFHGAVRIGKLQRQRKRLLKLLWRCLGSPTARERSRSRRSQSLREMFIGRAELISLLPDENTITQPNRQPDKAISLTFFNFTALSRSEVVGLVESNAAGLSG